MHISPEHLDAVQELLNIGVGRAADSLNRMLDKPISMHIPVIQLRRLTEISQDIQTMKVETLSSVQLPFTGNFSGSAFLLFGKECAVALARALNGESEDPATMDSLREATLTEIGNIVLNGVMGSLANILQHHITYSVPFYQEISLEELLQSAPADSTEMVLWAQTHFTIKEYDLTGDIMLMFDIPDLELLMTAVSQLPYSTTMPDSSI